MRKENLKCGFGWFHIPASRLQNMLWTGQTIAFKPISAIHMKLNQQPNCGSLND
jgi:hypothetical protein